jgi:hypothetical protein
MSIATHTDREIGDDDPITLQEACILIYRGNIKPSSLKAKADAKKLTTFKVGRTIFTRKRHIREMEECLEGLKAHDSTSTGLANSGQSETDKASSALASLSQTVLALKRGSSNTSARSTGPRPPPPR